MPRKRKVEVFSLSFLDCISCGFGAVVLLFVIINGQVTVRAAKAADTVMSETSRIDEEVLDGRKDLVRLRNSLREERERALIAQAEAARIAALVAKLTQDLKEGDSLAQRESVEQLKSDIKQLEEANQRLASRNAEAKPTTGQRIRAFAGEGNRQYLTGVRMSGKHVLILVDASASMLGKNYVNIVRFRSMNEEGKRKAPKFRQAVRSVEWLLTQMQPGTNVQIHAFNETPKSLFEGSAGWVDVKDKAALDRATARLRRLVPDKGTSLINAIRVAETLDPQPDNIFLITDGLPTQDEKPPPAVENVRSERRVKYMVDAIAAVPKNVPVNVMLLPMDGDPSASGFFWQMAVSSRGSFLTLAEDWP